MYLDQVHKLRRFTEGFSYIARSGGQEELIRYATPTAWNQPLHPYCGALDFHPEKPLLGEQTYPFYPCLLW
jgi:hypothetical protein